MITWPNLVTVNTQSYLLWDPSLAYRARLVSPWVFWLDYCSTKYEPWLDQTRLVSRPSKSIKKVLPGKIIWRIRLFNFVSLLESHFDIVKWNIITVKCLFCIAILSQLVFFPAPLHPCVDNKDCNSRATCQDGKCICQGKRTGNGKYCRGTVNYLHGFENIWKLFALT